MMFQVVVGARNAAERHSSMWLRGRGCFRRKVVLEELRHDCETMSLTMHDSQWSAHIHEFLEYQNTKLLSYGTNDAETVLI